MITPPPLPISDEHYKALTGVGGSAWYLKRFHAIDQRQTGQHWHWPAFFITFFWLLYRKMWLYGLLYLVASVVLGMLIPFAFGVLAALGSLEPAAVGSLSAAFMFGVFYVLPALFATPLYHYHCKQHISKVQAYTPDPALQLELLRQKGGTSSLPVVLVSILVPLGIIGILAAITLPAYQDYTLRARTGTAYNEALIAAHEVGEYYLLHDELPESLEQADPAFTLPPGVFSTWLDPDNGNLHVTMGPSHKSGTFILKPHLDDDGNVQWTCSNLDLPPGYLPYACR